MTEEERAKIISEDYADIILYRDEPHIIRGFPDSTIQEMNQEFEFGYIPVSQFTNRSWGIFGYSAIPKLFGLTSEINLSSSRVDELRSIPSFDFRGEGVLVGIIDTGIDYRNDAFKKADGTTKIVSIWDQSIDSTAESPFNTYFGTEYTAQQINSALNSPDPLSIVPSMDENGHGTMLAGIAAGTANPTEDFYGVAPEAELVVVKLRPAKQYLKRFFSVPTDVLCYQENHIMWGIHYCAWQARTLGKPIVICLGLGTSQGAHVGRARLSLYITYVADLPKVSTVISVGNEGNLGRHFFGTIDHAIGYNTVELNVSENGEGFSMELWGDTPGIYSIDILSPYGEYISRIAPSLHVTRDITFIFENTRIEIDYFLTESNTGDQLILLRFYDTTPGIWRFNVYGQGDLPLTYHIWLPMGDMISKQTYFTQPDIYTTLLAPGTATVPITITAYNPINEALYVNASRGYTRDNIIKPELAAPGVNYIAPTLSNGYATFTGTGAAAAHAAGIVALFMEWGVVRGNDPLISSTEIKNYLIRGARRKEILTYPNREWGYGIIDIYNTFNNIRLESTR